jgi:hypothetical protein
VAEHQNHRALRRELPFVGHVLGRILVLADGPENMGLRLTGGGVVLEVPETGAVAERRLYAEIAALLDRGPTQQRATWVERRATPEVVLCLALGRLAGIGSATNPEPHILSSLRKKELLEFRRYDHQVPESRA